MELTKLQKLLIIVNLANQMKKLNINTGFKFSEALRVTEVLENEIKGLPEKAVEEAYIQAMRNLYNGIFAVDQPEVD